MGLPTGSWLTELRRKVREGAPADTPVTIRWRDRGGQRERILDLGELRRRMLQLVPGQRIAYATDLAMTEDNAERLAALARGADLLYIEAAFLEADAEHARRKSHLTTTFAGAVATRAGVREAVPFHFSTRYLGEGEALEREFETASRCSRPVPEQPLVRDDAGFRKRASTPRDEPG